MSREKIPVDLFNPGQVFACLGFAEAAQKLVGETRGAFDWSNPTQTLFWLESPGDRSPFAEGLSFLAEAKVSARTCHEGLDTKKWDVETDFGRDADAFPIFPPPSPATLPAALTANGRELRFDHWGDKTLRDNVKFWAGSGGYPGAGLLRDALNLVRDRIPKALDNPFDLSAVQSSSFRLDWRRDYIPIDAGFSLNAHGNIKTKGYPLVEVFGAFGLAYARPMRPERANKLLYRYGVIASTNDDLLPLNILRASLGGSRELPFPQRTFLMNLDWPGQEGQARCITTVYEESNND